MQNDLNVSPNNQESNDNDKNTEEILESEISEGDYQFTEKGFEPEKK